MSRAARFEYLVCYGVGDRITFSNGEWLGEDIPEAKRKSEDALACPLMWEFLATAGAEGWELITILEAPPTKFGTVRHYFLKRQAAD